MAKPAVCKSTHQESPTEVGQSAMRCAEVRASLAQKSASTSRKSAASCSREGRPEADAGTRTRRVRSTGTGPGSARVVAALPAGVRGMRGAGRCRLGRPPGPAGAVGGAGIGSPGSVRCGRAEVRGARVADRAGEWRAVTVWRGGSRGATGGAANAWVAEPPERMVASSDRQAANSRRKAATSTSKEVTLSGKLPVAEKLPSGCLPSWRVREAAPAAASPEPATAWGCVRGGRGATRGATGGDNGCRGANWPTVGAYLEDASVGR